MTEDELKHLEKWAVPTGVLQRLIREYRELAKEHLSLLRDNSRLQVQLEQWRSGPDSEPDAETQEWMNAPLGSPALGPRPGPYPGSDRGIKQQDQHLDSRDPLKIDMLDRITDAGLAEAHNRLVDLVREGQQEHGRLRQRAAKLELEYEFRSITPTPKTEPEPPPRCRCPVPRVTTIRTCENCGRTP